MKLVSGEFYMCCTILTFCPEKLSKMLRHREGCSSWFKSELKLLWRWLTVNNENYISSDPDLPFKELCGELGLSWRLLLFLLLMRAPPRPGHCPAPQGSLAKATFDAASKTYSHLIPHLESGVFTTSPSWEVTDCLTKTRSSPAGVAQ